jgi:hypothetical protein
MPLWYFIAPITRHVSLPSINLTNQMPVFYIKSNPLQPEHPRSNRLGGPADGLIMGVGRVEGKPEYAAISFCLTLGSICSYTPLNHRGFFQLNTKFSPNRGNSNRFLLPHLMMVFSKLPWAMPFSLYRHLLKQRTSSIN